MLSNLPHPIVFAHRGSSAHAPENTLAAFNLAIEQGADAIELDARLSADGQVVVIHDNRLDRIAGVQKEVRHLSLAELKTLDVGRHFKSPYEGERIPTLSEVFKLFGKKTYINIELKNLSTPNDDLPQKAANLVKQFAIEDHVFFSSFNPFALIRIRQYLPKVPIGLLITSGWLGYLTRIGIGSLIKYDALHPWLGDVSSKLVDSAHDEGKKVHVYTVNNPEDIRRMIAFDVDGIFTDDPKMALQILR